MDDEEIQFVNPPPYDYTCPVCLQLLKDAYQTTCCGNHMCGECITQLMHMKDVICPKCRHKNFDAHPDKFFSRQLLNLKVHCHYSKTGCTWTGELRGLEQHLETTCKRGMVACQHCNSQIESIKEHLPTCEEIFLDCPNKCSNAKSKRKKIQSHLENECPLRVIIPLSRDSIPYAANKIVQTVPLSFTMTNSSHYLKSKDPWFSAPFYTHNEGYKLCLKLLANYYKDGVIAVHACVLKGKYDRFLQWPLHAAVEVSLFNWRDNRNHFNKTLDLPGDHFCSQTFTEKLPLLGKGNSEFISCSELLYNSDKNTEYLQHDCLSFRVNRVTIFPTPKIPELPPWATEKCLCHFVVTSFAYNKSKAAKFCSPPFYTHDRGYKLFALAYLDGFDTGKGSHVSLYVALMKGEHDDILAWPFSGDVCISMLNWREDKNHQESTIRFNKGIASAATARVVAGHNVAPKCWGYPQFIAHSALPYNGSTKTEFLRDDCLLLKVKSAVFYSSFGNSKVPSWRHHAQNSQSLCEFTLSQFSLRKQHNNEFYSDAFFSHRNGYKMQLRVDANKKGHVGVFVFIMKGPNDDNLLWPFCGDIVVELLNWRENGGHYKKIIQLSPNVTNTARSRVTDGERGSGWGYEQCIQHSALEVNNTNNTQYLHDDCLYFRVKEVAVYSTALCHKSPRWQSDSPYPEFTLTNFSKYLDLGTSYVSKAFLTHNQGYKFRLEVRARRTNVDSCEHIAVYANIMKCENDHNLVWPLEADFCIELLNWRGNFNHHRHTISFHERIDNKYRCQVTTGEANSDIWGTYKFIPYSSLKYNSTTNTEYLQGDCLRFRIKEVAVYSTPHSRKIPIWQSRSPTKFPEFTITQFSHRLRLENDFYSRPVYTSHQGYKMCFNVSAGGNGSGKGTHVSMHAYLLKGDHDDTLRWPFTGDVVIDILNWKGDHNHHRKVLQFNDDSTDDSRNRVYEADTLAPSGWGNCKVVPHSILFSRYTSAAEYLEDDCMRIRLYDVAVYNTLLLSKTPQWQNWFNTSSSWPLEFTVTGVSKHKLYDTEHLSPPFYTHQDGYKMRLEVWPNGNSDGKGTHLSIFARLLKGENDHNLKWPMNIDLTVEVINWHSNNSHIINEITFQHASDRVRAQVIGESKAVTGWGLLKFCTHYTLFSNSRNIQYVQDDCIRVRVRGAIIHSRKGLFSR